MTSRILAAAASLVFAAACFVPVAETSGPGTRTASFIEPPRDAGVDGGTFGGAGDGGCNVSVILNTQLPNTLHEAAAFFDGQKIWVLGGSSQGDVPLDTIFSFDPATEQLATSQTTLPAAEQAAYFASKGSVIYLFGGDNGAGGLRSIVKFDSSTQSVTTMNAQLPTTRMKGAAVWHGQHIYLFGGWTGAVTSDILEYDTVSDSLRQLPSDPSLRREQAAAFAFGNAIYIASGHISQPPLQTYPEVVRFDPATGGVTATALRNPVPRFFTGASTDGARGYIFGGIRADNHDVNEVMRLDVAGDSFEQVGCLAHSKHGNAWTYANGSFYSLGGMNVPSRTWLRSIQKWTPRP